MAFFYYLNTKTNNLEFKKVMRRFKLEYNQKKINMFDMKYTFIKIVDLTQEEYFSKLLRLEILSFPVHRTLDIFIFNPNFNNTPSSEINDHSSTTE